jgi:hypothetical protein
LAFGVLETLVFVGVDLGELLQLTFEDTDVVFQLVGLAPLRLKGLWHLRALGLREVYRQVVVGLQVIVLVSG